MSQTKLFPRRSDIAERDFRPAMGLFFVQALVLQFVGLEFQMGLNLLSKIICTPSTPELDSSLLTACTPAASQTETHRPC